MSESGIRPLDSSASLGPIEPLDTPERIRLDLELAGPMSRAFAFSIDYTLILLLMTIAFLVVVAGSQQIVEWLSEFSFITDWVDRVSTWVGDSEEIDPDSIMRSVALSIAIWLVLDLVFTTSYFMVFETLLRGRTPGKMLTHLRVVSADGGVVGWRQSLLRNLLRIVDSMPAGYAVAIVSMLTSKRVQRLGDLVASTVVIRERQNVVSQGNLDIAVAPDIEAAFRFTRSELAAVGEIERRLIRRTLRRAESLSNRAAAPILERTTQAITRRIAPDRLIDGARQRDFLRALLGASERLL